MILAQCIFIVYLPYVSSVVNQFTKPNGDLDVAALTSHMIQLEKTVSDLQSQSRLQEQKQAAVMSSVLSKLASTTAELSVVQTNLRTLEKKHNDTMLKLANVENELESLKKDSNSTNHDFVKFQSQITLFAGVQKTMATEITDMKKGNNSLRQQLARMDDKLRLVNTELASLENRQNLTMIDLLNVTSKIDQLESDLHPLSANLSKLNETMEVIPMTVSLENIEKQVQTIKNISDQKVFFKADMSTVKTIPGKSIIVFDNVTINDGGGYNSSSGIFRAPVSGIYFFAASFQSLSDNVFKITIVKNGEAQTQFTTLKKNEQASSSTVFNVGEGGHVYVKMITSNPRKFQKNILTQFTGCLLRADYM